MSFFSSDELHHLFQLVTPKYVFSDSDTIGKVEKLLPSLGKDTQIILFDSTEVKTVSTKQQKSEMSTLGIFP